MEISLLPPDSMNAFLQVDVREVDQNTHSFVWDDNGITGVMKFTRIGYRLATLLDHSY